MPACTKDGTRDNTQGREGSEWSKGGASLLRPGALPVWGPTGSTRGPPASLGFWAEGAGKSIASACRGCTRGQPQWGREQGEEH